MVANIRTDLPLLLMLLANLPLTAAWVSSVSTIHFSKERCFRANHRHKFELSSSPDEWKGEVVSNNPEGKITGCTITAVGDEPVVEWVVTIDGEEADLGGFTKAIYKKVTEDAKKQQFQGFRPGTIPPHLEPTYRAFAMDECARETVLEALQQNNIRPFENTRSEFILENFCIPPPIKKKAKKKKKKKNSTEKNEEDAQEEPKWLTFENMKGAVDAGWKPGQSFSFVAKKVKGQKVKGETEIVGARPLGGLYY